ncbi:hypothetical protein ABB30_04850 [Stenotrophomonas ginsengisoli]|uniref:Colicin immunity protein n=1 Tax=Stenotrophomonas ginsengisoli TaxID=336566 RepID=A0A0R0D9G0_9GAMM|nr:hypothetical protein ABB30_04850 [Stenotrophomonas ginsengisoli]
MITVRKLTRQELFEIAENIFNPSEGGPSEAEIDMQLYAFCMNCPDPVGAMELIIEAPRGITSAEVFEQAFFMQERRIETWSAEDLPMDHPLRYCRFASE